MHLFVSYLFLSVTNHCESDLRLCPPRARAPPDPNSNNNGTGKDCRRTWEKWTFSFMFFLIPGFSLWTAALGSTKQWCQYMKTPFCTCIKQLLHFRRSKVLISSSFGSEFLWAISPAKCPVLDVLVPFWVCLSVRLSCFQVLNILGLVKVVMWAENIYSGVFHRYFWSWFTSNVRWLRSCKIKNSLFNALHIYHLTRIHEKYFTNADGDFKNTYTY